MKKFLLTLCVSTPSVKGIYTALFILILTTTATAQIELKDNINDIPYHKWEVSVDLKPLFRKDEPYNIFVKRYLTERKALRLGFFSSNIQNSDSTLDILGRANVGGQWQYFQITRNRYKFSEFEIRLGYQFGVRKNAISIYTATDLSYKFSSYSLVSNGAQSGDTGQVKPFEGYFPFIGKDIRIGNYGLSQSIGIKYYIHAQLSLGVEGAFRFNYSMFSFDSRELPYVDMNLYKHTNLKGYNYSMSFVPLMGLYLNYYF